MKHGPHHPPPPVDLPPSAAGQWEMIAAEFLNSATHAALLPTNKVFIYGGSSLDPDEFEHPSLPRAEILDLNTDPWRTYPVDCEPMACDLWCGGHTFLADGRLLFVGGTSYYPPDPDPFYGGLKEAWLFDPFSESWERLDDMRAGRWYPTLIRLADDRVLTVAGLEYRSPDEVPQKNVLKILYELIRKMEQRIVRLQEVFDPVTKKWISLTSLQKMPLYPRLHLLPDGDVFYTGVFNTHFLTPGRYPSARWSSKSEQWMETGGSHFRKNREEGISLLLALRPPSYKPQILIAGGGTHNVGRTIMSLLHSIGRDSWSHFFAFLTRVEDTVEQIDLSRPDPGWEFKGKMNHPRVHANGVLLPDGNVLVVGGMSSYGHGGGIHGDTDSVCEAELYNPVTNTWTRMAAQQKARLYHSTALLLPDGRVLSMGSNPGEKQIERTIEVFSPPYLFRGERPVIDQLPEQITYNQPFRIDVDHAQPIQQVV
ncbi:MAG TPA: hypothetical protein VFY26_19080, partial [Anaerolineales bacterium]|nr:hypothetical protein [Anaerolineales bacterium]